MSQSDITIRPAIESDAPAIYDLILQLAVYEKLRDSVQSTERDIREALFGSRPVAEAILAETSDSVPVGFALFYTNFSTFAGRPGLYLEDLFVIPDRRGQGIGKRLLRELAKIAHDRNYARMEWVVLDWNESAIRFYENLGASVLPDWRIVRHTNAIELANPQEHT